MQDAPTVASRRSQPTPDVFLLNLARSILQKSEVAERLRTQTAVTLRRRFRGTSKSDLFGFFYAQNGQWLGDDPAQQPLLGDLYAINITKNIIQANQSAMAQARVENTIIAASEHDKRLEGVAAVGRGIYKLINNHPDFWSNNLENQVNQQIQTDFGIWLRCWFDRNADSPFRLKIDEYSDEPLEEPGEYACQCGAGGPLFSDMMGQATDDQVPCLKCGQMAEIVNMPEMGNVPMFHSSREIPAGNMRLETVSMFQVRIDERNTKSGNIRRGRFLEHHYLVDEEELQSWVPYFELGGASEWSYPIKWEHCLETGTDLYLKPWGADMSADLQPPHEVRRIYLRPEMYRHYRSPIDFTLDRGDGRAAVGQDGRSMLQLRRGGGFDQYPNGFWYLVDSDRLLPCVEECDFRDEWSYFGFVNDAASTYYQPCTELSELQRYANNLYTIDVQQRESASMNTTIYDAEFFDGDDLEQQLAPTKPGVMLQQGDDIRHHASVFPGVPSTGAMEGIKAILEMKADIVGVQPAMLGKVQPGVAYAAQALQREQSLGRLAPSQYSKAEAKSIVVLQLCKHAQKNMPPEWFDYVSMRYGGEFKDQDVQEYLNANLDLAIVVGYKEDSVVPQTLIQRQLAYQQVLTTVAQAAKSLNDPKLFTVEMVNKYQQLMLGEGAIDLENVDADESLADSRYRKIVARLQEQDRGQPVPTIVQDVLMPLDFHPLPFEGHPVHIAFLIDRITGLEAEDHPDYTLIACLIEMIARHKQAAVEDTQEQVGDQIEGQAPAIAATAAAQQAQAAGAAQAAQAKAQGDAQMKVVQAQADARLQAQQNQFDAEMKLKDMGEAATQREHEAEMKEAELALRAAELASKHPDNQPADHVSESMAYKDTVPSIQRQMEAREGYIPATDEEHKAQVKALKQPAKPPAANGGKPKPATRPLA